MALAAAATLTPVVAQADSIAPLAPSLSSFATALGDSAGQPVGAVCDGIEAGDCTLVTAVPTAAALAGSQQRSTLEDWLQPVFQNQLWWFGTPNPNPPERTVVFTYNPPLLKLLGWFPDLNFESCFLGFTSVYGPYGSVTGSYSRGCA
jgi:hypothetical protein